MKSVWFEVTLVAAVVLFLFLVNQSFATAGMISPQVCIDAKCAQAVDAAETATFKYTGAEATINMVTSYGENQARYWVERMNLSTPVAAAYYVRKAVLDKAINLPVSRHERIIVSPNSLRMEAKYELPFM